MDNNVFEEMAKRYDSDERRALAEVIVQEVRLQLQQSESKSLLDYGCGTGLIGLELTDLVDSVLFVDSSEQMIEVVQEKIARSGLTNAQALCADFTKETPDVKADIVLVSFVLLHIPDTKKILKKIAHILNDGGMLLIVDFDKNDAVTHPRVHNGFSHEDLRELLSGAGLTSISIKTFYHGKKIFVKEDASMFIASSMK